MQKHLGMGVTGVDSGAADLRSTARDTCSLLSVTDNGLPWVTSQPIPHRIFLITTELRFDFTKTGGFQMTILSSAKREYDPRFGPTGTEMPRGSQYIRKRGASGSTNMGHREAMNSI